MSKKNIKPTEKEMEVLQVILEKGSVSVKDVHETLGGEEANGYTTILKIMQIMHEKGMLTRQKSGKLHLYKTAQSPENVRKHLLDNFVNNVFKGSAMHLVMSALGSRKSSQEELAQIREYLDKLEDENP